MRSEEYGSDERPLSVQVVAQKMLSLSTMSYDLRDGTPSGRFERDNTHNFRVDHA